MKPLLLAVTHKRGLYAGWFESGWMAEEELKASVDRETSVQGLPAPQLPVRKSHKYADATVLYSNCCEAFELFRG